jgi:glycosyltransferase involved in cell wall biosynthesis
MHVYSLGGNPADMMIKYGLGKRAKVFDYFIPEDKKPLFFGAADVVVLSYTKVFASTSSMLLEAAKFGIPVIASNNHPLGDDVLRYDLGLCFEAENVDSLINTIQAFRGLDTATHEQMRKNGVQYAANNSISKWATEWERQGMCLTEN